MGAKNKANFAVVGLSIKHKCLPIISPEYRDFECETLERTID